MRVIFYSALQSAPSLKKPKIIETESIDDTDKVLEDIKRNQANYNDDNLEISKSPNQLNRFDALQLDDEKEQSEIKINNEGISNEDNDDDDDDDEEEEEGEDLSEEEDEDVVEQIREDVLAYEQLNETKKKNLSLVVNRAELIHLLKCFYTHKTTTRENILTIGMVNKSEEFE
jgi:glutaredoxin-related protein